MQNIKELMKPRYLVIADYPSHCFQIGDIIHGERAYLIAGEGWSEKDSMSEYPAIFRKLEWWQEITIENMPKHLMTKDEMDMFEVIYYGDDIKSDVFVFWAVSKNRGWHSLYDLIPVTPGEYTAYLKTINQNQ